THVVPIARVRPRRSPRPAVLRRTARRGHDHGADPPVAALDAAVPDRPRDAELTPPGQGAFGSIAPPVVWLAPASSSEGVGDGCGPMRSLGSGRSCSSKTAF